MGDAAIAARGQEEHLVLERVGAERPAMAENNGLTLAPIIVVDLRAVLGGDRGHRVRPFLYRVGVGPLDIRWARRRVAPVSVFFTGLSPAQAVQSVSLPAGVAVATSSHATIPSSTVVAGHGWAAGDPGGRPHGLRDDRKDRAEERSMVSPSS
jgi:hypothetical protein